MFYIVAAGVVGLGVVIYVLVYLKLDRRERPGGLFEISLGPLHWILHARAKKGGALFLSREVLLLVLLLIVAVLAVALFP